MHRPPLALLLFAGTLIGSLALAQPYIVPDPPTRFDDSIVAGPVPEAQPAPPQVVEVDKLPVAPDPAPPVVAEAAPASEVAPPVGPSCEDAPKHHEMPPPRGNAAALAAREMVSWGVLDDLLEARGDRGLPVPLGDAPLTEEAASGLPCAVTLQ